MKIAKLRHRLKLCSQKDVVTENGLFVLNREGVANMWAHIEEKAASPFSTQGAGLTQNNMRTHVIMTRYYSSLNISNMAWLYEERRKSSPRWFKILKVGQTETSGSVYFKFDCRLVERADDLVEPKESAPVTNLPPGVVL